MLFATSFSPIRAFVLGFALVSLNPAQAQKSTIKTKSNKVKTKNSSAPGKKVIKSKVVLAAPAAAPHPISPVASAPQVVEAAPAASTTITAAPTSTPTPAPAAVPTGWLTDLSAAQALAKSTNRPILAVFSGSDWCKPCIMYEQEVFAKPEFEIYAKDKLVLAHFDFPRQKRNQPTAAQLKLNEAAAAQLNHEGDFPLAVIIAPDGKVLAKTGYIAGGPVAFEAYLKKVIPTL